DTIPNDFQLEEDLGNLLRQLGQLYASETETTLPHENQVEVQAVSVNSDAAWDDLKRKTLWDDRELEELVATLEEASGQIVLAGPPGTGKTRVAIALANYLTDKDPERWRMVQFHPTYSYEEFMGGLRPTSNEGVMTFDFV